MAIVEIIKYNGGPDVLAWKYPKEELGTWTQLIVNESQQAILYKNGQMLDVFEGGRHTLNTENIPILNKIINIPFGGRSPFAAEVWYVNKAYNLDVKWGTPTPIQIQDAKYGVFVPVRSNGSFGIRIQDSKKFLMKLVGTLRTFRTEDVIKYFRGMYITKVKDSISAYLIHKQISVVEVNAYIDELSEYMKERIRPEIEEYGIQLVSFYANDISIPEDDPAVKQLKSALAKKAEMNIIGYDYQQERSFDTLSSPFMGLGIGLSMGQKVGNLFQNIAGNIKPSGWLNKECLNCHAPIPKRQRYCEHCGFDNADDLQTEAADLAVVKCSKCGREIKKESKFCPECGASLIKQCPKCNAIIEGSPKFCPECGRKIAGGI